MKVNIKKIIGKKVFYKFLLTPFIVVILAVIALAVVLPGMGFNLSLNIDTKYIMIGLSIIIIAIIVWQLASYYIEPKRTINMVVNIELKSPYKLTKFFWSRAV